MTGRTQSGGSLLDLLQPLGGLCSVAPVYAPYADEPAVVTRTVRLGDVGSLWPEIAKRGDAASVIHGAGAGLDADEALVPAVAEALERYSMSVFRKEQFLRASAAELGAAALDLDCIPRCSAAELAHPKCPLTLPDKAQPIRWVRGVSALSGRLAYLPVVMVYAYAGFAAPAEKFWLVTSSGCAAHTSYERALLAAIYENIERDAISVVWLQKLPLPRIEVDCFPAPLADYWQRHLEASSGFDYLFFDATTDLAVPTVYALQISRHNRRAATLVSCATGNSAAGALAKAMRDMAACRIAFRAPREVPKDYDEFTDVFHGAAFMARAENAGAFDFLTRGPRAVRLTAMPDALPESDALPAVLRNLRRKNMDVWIADLSTDEAIRAGMRVVRAIIPGLQPLSFRYRARFLGHSRLYAAPRLMGYPVLEESQLNPWPQPFA